MVSFFLLSVNLTDPLGFIHEMGGDADLEVVAALDTDGFLHFN